MRFLFAAALVFGLASTPVFAKPHAVAPGTKATDPAAKATAPAVNGAAPSTAATLTTPVPPLEPGQVRVCLVGDSTVANRLVPTNVYGWGEFFLPWKNPEYHVDNMAKKGESSLSYQTNSLWKIVMDVRPAVVFIQFGHNDALTGTAGFTTPQQGYRSALLHYLDGCKKIHARPILITPVHPLAFDVDGTLMNNLDEYAEVMREVAKENSVTLLDLHKDSAIVWTRLGPQMCQQLQAKEGDFIHLNRLAARAVAEIVRRELRDADPAFAGKLLRQPETATSKATAASAAH
jgi:lysophospholipase L1-like esterase